MPGQKGDEVSPGGELSYVSVTGPAAMKAGVSGGAD